MRIARRHDLAPRVEMMPLIDVIFLLLTFFIYSLIMMVHAEILPVHLPTVTTGEAAEPTEIAAVTIDRAGRLFLNRKAITAEQLDIRLRQMAKLKDRPKLFVALEVPEHPDAVFVDRGPLFIALIDRVRRAGMTDFNIVGQEELK